MQRPIECELVIQVTRERTPERDAALERALASRPDWTRVLQLADAHGVLPFLDAAAHEFDWDDAMPPAVRKPLYVLAGAILLGNLASLRATADVLRELTAQRVEAIVLKGPALVTTLYATVGLRPFSDLDLLCRADQLQAADTALRTRGYRPDPQKRTEQDDFHILYTGGSTALPIELHADPLQLGIPARCRSALWRHPERITIEGEPALMLALDHSIVQLCVHLHTHGYSRLIWFKDLDLLLRRRGTEVDWSRVQDVAREEGATLSLRWALMFLRDLLATPLPPEALNFAVDNPVGQAAHRLLWPSRHVLALEGKQRLRSVRFNPHRGPLGVVPSLLVMGRRRDKLVALLPRRATRDLPPSTRALSHRAG